MAGLGYKVFTAGEVLTAANVNGYLMEQSVMVFAGTAARSSAIGTPTEGMVTYLEDTNQVEVYNGATWVGVSATTPITTQGDLIVGNASGAPARLAIGANGTVLQSNGTTASWVSASAGSMTLLSTTSLTGTTVNIGSISSAHKDLLVEIIGITTSLGAVVSFDFRNGTNIIEPRIAGVDVNANTPTATRSLSLILIGTSNATNPHNALAIYIKNYASTNNYQKSLQYWGYNTDNGGNERYWNLAGGFKDADTGAIDNLNIVSGQTFTAGTVKIYGVN